MRCSAHAVAFEVDVVGVVYDAVEDRVSDRWFAECGVPRFDW
jgi:hypothetical protein